MKINNYDMNSKGINIELSIFYDTCLAGIYFKENFVEYLGGYVYVDFGNIVIDEFKKQHDIIKYFSKGYCQGDALYIYINKTLLKRSWRVVNIDMVSLKQKIDNYLWDTPLHFHLEINNKLENRNIELYQYDIFDNEYIYYDKDSIVEVLKKYLTISELKEVINILPEEVEYL